MKPGADIGDGARYRRGAQLVDAKEFARQLGREWRGRERPLTLAGLPVPPQDETKHFKFIGTTGTGKSTAICELLDGALARGDRAIIADPDGGYLRRFYRFERGDVILNPFMADSVKWEPFAEIGSVKDVDLLAQALLPETESGSAKEWRGYARTFLSAVTLRLWENSAHRPEWRTTQELFRVLAVADLQELRVLLDGTPAAPLVQPDNERMFGSVRSVASAAVNVLKHIVPQQAQGFSVREWVRQGANAMAGSQRGVLFIPYAADEIAALKSPISAWMRLGVVEAMKQGEGDQRLWFIVDEFDALGKIDGLKDALPRLRKFGGRCVLGLQSIAQVSSTYGAGDAHTIVENCGNSLILRCSASEGGGTSKFASQLIGQREVLRTLRSRSRRPADLLSSTTRAEHLDREAAVLDSQIEQLPDLTGYQKFASHAPWVRVKLKPFQYGSSSSSGPSASARAATVPKTGVLARVAESLRKIAVPSRKSARERPDGHKRIPERVAELD